MTQQPRTSEPSPDEEGGASRIAEIVEAGKTRWERVQRLHPVRMISHFTDTGGGILAGGMSYQALFAVFAGLWVGFGVFGIVLRDRPELLASLVDQLQLFVPGLVGDDGAVSINTLLEARILDWTSLIAAVSLLWVVIAWFTGTRRAIRLIFGLDVKQYKNPLLLKIRDFVLAIGFAIAIVLSAALTVLSSTVITTIYGWIGADPNSWLLGGLGTVARYGAMYLFDVLILMSIHRYLAEVKVPIRRLVSGCMVGGVGLFLIKFLGTLLLGGATSNPLLASFAVLVGLLLWFNFICRTLLYTSSWIATGLDKSLGLHLDLVEATV